MSISITKRKYIISLTILTLILGVIGGGIYYSLVPEHYFGGYPFISVYFFVFGVFKISMFDVCRMHAPDKLLLMYLALKVLKMILSVIVLVIYCMVVREEAKEFLLTFIAQYMFYLVFDTCFFLNFELKKKLQKKNELKKETVA